MTELRVRNDELRIMRQASPELGSMFDVLERGELDKLVLPQRKRMRAVAVSAERYSEMQRQLEQSSLDRRAA